MKNNLSYLIGIVLTLVLALLAIWLTRYTFLATLNLSAILVATVLGFILGNSIYPIFVKYSFAGVNFTKQKLLRLAIILFGFKLTLHDIALAGLSSIVIDILMVLLTFILTYWLARHFFALDQPNAILIGSGCSICGAAAVMATAQVIKAEPEQTTIAITIVVIFGTLALFIYPLIYALLTAITPIDQSLFGLYIGSTIHEVAQVIVAGRAISDQAMNIAVITKMIRVLLLVPFLFALSFWLMRRQRAQTASSGKMSVPWFALIFLAMVGVNSSALIPPLWVYWLVQCDDVLLAMVMIAFGLTSHYSVMVKAGIKPFLLGLCLFFWLIVGGGIINGCVTWLFYSGT